MIISAHAKINLTLNVLGKLPNKYHELQTVFYLLPNISDSLEFKENGADTIEIYSGDFCRTNAPQGQSDIQNGRIYP